MEKKQMIATILALSLTGVQLCLAILIVNLKPEFVLYYYLCNDFLLIVIGLTLYRTTSKKLKIFQGNFAIDNAISSVKKQYSLFLIGMLYFCMINSCKIAMENQIPYDLLLVGFGLKEVVHIVPILYMLLVHRKTMSSDN